LSLWGLLDVQLYNFSHRYQNITRTRNNYTPGL